ncbi:hypothetical protein A3L09_08695 [Thermococcus profundus]|uniref:Uncharacterized protein n=1 Tax=Thermococcus profundus TaxID=49899 RepID=A0A2Z2MCU8_THEPR|nr:hypothetical protein [Thermococcus profundus]ASJ03329.1 hypothetical protein A3L09_08695 [Thermococcus profundus]
MDEDRALKIIEYGIEALLIGWFTYLFAYQNYLLYRWHRGLPLPSKFPSLLLGIAAGAGFLAYELWKMKKTPSQSQAPVEKPSPEAAGETDETQDHNNPGE